MKIYQSWYMYLSRVAINRFHLKLFLTFNLLREWNELSFLFWRLFFFYGSMFVGCCFCFCLSSKETRGFCFLILSVNHNPKKENKKAHI